MINKHTLDRYSLFLGAEKVKQHSNDMSNSWLPYDFNSNLQPGYRKNVFGFVQLEGVAKSGTINATMFTLPSDYRPPYNHLLVAVANSAVARTTIGYDGQVIPTIGNNAYYSLQTMGFPTYIDGWSYPSFSGAWANYGSGWALASYMKDPFGIVHLQGLVKSGTSGTAIFTLPTGYRPEYTQILPTFTDTGIGQIRIGADGIVTHTNGGTGYISLSGMSFISATSPLNDEWQDLTLQNSWVNYDAGFAPPQILQTPLGEIFMRGLIKNGTATGGTTLFTVPTWARSILRRIFPIITANAFGFINFENNGNANVGGASNTFVSLDSLQYLANWLS